MRTSLTSATLPAVSESAYKPTEAYEDELDQLAHSIRGELRAAGFRPAFDPEPEAVAPSSQFEQSGRRRRTTLRRMILGYVAPMIVMIAVVVLLRVILPVL